MSPDVIGQRCLSEPEPELGLGVVTSIESGRIAVRFPAAGVERLYKLGTAVLKRVRFREGDSVATRAGRPLVIESVDDHAGLLVYDGISGGQRVRVREDEISDVTSVDLPQERFLAGQVDPGEVFDLRRRALDAQWRFRQSEVRGFVGGRVELLPHQLYIVHEVSSWQIPRALLSDEVGLGKTIEACLIVHRLLTVGRASRVLVLVPESLTHQWFVELLRRFNLWFSIYDEERCVASGLADPAGNPFLDEQLVLCSVGFLAGDETRREQAIAAGWDMVVVDEAHHLEWSPDEVSEEYAMVERLAARSPGLLLLTATPTQLGLQGHFARLRLLDPDRYRDFATFMREAEDFQLVAEIAGRIIDCHPLKSRDHTALKRIFGKDPEGLHRHLAALTAGTPGARESLLRALLDEHGTGRVVFRNSRASMKGFPKRKFCPEVLVTNSQALLARVAREIEAEETGHTSDLHYSFRNDPRIDWLAGFLKKHRPAKVLLICRSQRKAAAIEAALREKLNVATALFHEGLTLVQRDRNAAWFAEKDGARLLICSEIGSEGRNFQFAHHLVLWDLPLDPALVEQRIGRLDRIGQTQTIHVHVPHFEGSAVACVVAWFHRGLDAIETPLHGASEYVDAFREPLLALALAHGRGGSRSHAADLDAFLRETIVFRRKVSERLARGRDRLLELSSFNRDIANHIVDMVRAVDGDPFLRRFLLTVMEHFGVQVREHEEGDVFLDPSHAYIERFPSIPSEGMLVTFDRTRAIAREDIRFVSQDHPLVRDTLDLLLNSKSGTTALGAIESDEPNVLLEAVFVLETVADSRWHVDQFLAPTPLRVLVDIHGNNLGEERSAAALAAEVRDGDIHRFLERPGFSTSALKTLLESAGELAEARARSLREHARDAATSALGAEVQRLIDLARINDHVRPTEIALARERLERTAEAIGRARLRLDAIRVVVEGPGLGV